MRNILIISTDKITKDEELFLTQQYVDREGLTQDEEVKNIGFFPRFLYLSTLNVEIANKINDEWLNYEEKQEIVQQIMNLVSLHNIYAIYSTGDYMLTELLTLEFPNTVASSEIFMSLMEIE